MNKTEIKKNYVAPSIEVVEMSAAGLLTSLSVWVEKAQVEEDNTWSESTEQTTNNNTPTSISAGDNSDIWD